MAGGIFTSREYFGEPLGKDPTQSLQSEVGNVKRKNSDPVGTNQVAKVEKFSHISPSFSEVVGGGRGFVIN